MVNSKATPESFKQKSKIYTLVLFILRNGVTVQMDLTKAMRIQLSSSNSVLNILVSAFFFIPKVITGVYFGRHDYRRGLRSQASHLLTLIFLFTKYLQKRV